MSDKSSISPKKKIFICADYFLPGFKAGGPIQSLTNLIHVLANQFDVYVLTRNHDWGDSILYELPVNQWTVNRDCKICYLSENTLRYRVIKEKLGEIKPDFVYLNSLYSPFSRYILKLFFLKRTHIPLILALRGELNEGAIKIKQYKKLPYIWLLRLLGISKIVIWHVTNETEKDKVKAFFGDKSQTILLQNIPKQTQSQWFMRSKKEGEVRFVIVARIDKMKNIDFLINRFIDLKNGKITIDIIGSAKDDSYLQKCTALTKGLPLNVKVNFVGTLSPELIETILPTYHFFILPTLGENFGHAIFESLLEGVPVLISNRTPWMDLEKNHAGWIIPLDTTSIWNEHIQKCIDMTELEYNKYSESAWLFAQKYNKQFIYNEQLHKMFS